VEALEREVLSKQIKAWESYKKVLENVQLD